MDTFRLKSLGTFFFKRLTIIAKNQRFWKKNSNVAAGRLFSSEETFIRSAEEKSFKKC